MVPIMTAPHHVLREPHPPYYSQNEAMKTLQRNNGSKIVATGILLTGCDAIGPLADSMNQYQATTYGQRNPYATRYPSTTPYVPVASDSNGSVGSTSAEADASTSDDSDASAYVPSNACPNAVSNGFGYAIGGDTTGTGGSAYPSTSTPVSSSSVGSSPNSNRWKSPLHDEVAQRVSCPSAKVMPMKRIMLSSFSSALLLLLSFSLPTAALAQAPSYVGVGPNDVRISRSDKYWAIENMSDKFIDVTYQVNERAVQHYVGTYTLIVRPKQLWPLAYDLNGYIVGIKGAKVHEGKIY
jgi:hypothetical protein